MVTKPVSEQGTRKRLLFYPVWLILALLILALGYPEACQARVVLSGLFSDHMVLQRNVPIRVFGQADPKEIIGVGIGENKAVAFADENGRWLVTLKPMPAGGPYELTVVSGDQKTVVRDVLIGEVWLCSGQSNMVLSNKNSDLEEEIAATKFDSRMRFLKLPPRVSARQEYEVNATWKIFDNDTAPGCSAVATAFALKVQREIDIPVGVVIAAVGGSPIQPWLSREGLNSYPDGRGLIKKIDSIEKGLKEKNFPTRNLVLNARESMKKKIEEDPARQLFLSPTTLYNTMINPLAPYFFKGVLWYQGEANVYESDDYGFFLTTLIRDWRARFDEPEMPFLYVQLPPYGARQLVPVKASPVAELRFAQSRAVVVPYAYMAVTLDCCHVKEPDWHACDRAMIGRRLADIALATQYNKPYPYKSPSLFTHDRKDNRVVLHFRNTMKSLKSAGSRLEGFSIAGRDDKLFWANAELKGDSVEVWCDKIKKPLKVYYAWADNPRGNLLGHGDLPVVPFELEVE
ncbi:hypothetical protein GC174_04145 [bacterium]|nr:hypothetical protein [bacterium]